MGDKKYLTECELKVMHEIWDRGQCTLMEIVNSLPDWKQQTVSTFIHRMESKGFVAHRREGRQYIYYPLRSKRECYLDAKEKFIEMWDQGIHDPR